jgi:hypothetical protein
MHHEDEQVTGEFNVKLKIIDVTVFYHHRGIELGGFLAELFSDGRGAFPQLIEGFFGISENGLLGDGLLF